MSHNADQRASKTKRKMPRRKQKPKFRRLIGNKHPTATQNEHRKSKKARPKSRFIAKDHRWGLNDQNKRYNPILHDTQKAEAFERPTIFPSINDQEPYNLRQDPLPNALDLNTSDIQPEPYRPISQSLKSKSKQSHHSQSHYHQNMVGYGNTSDFDHYDDMGGYGMIARPNGAMILTKALRRIPKFVFKKRFENEQSEEFRDFGEYHHALIRGNEPRPIFEREQNGKVLVIPDYTYQGRQIKVSPINWVHVAKGECQNSACVDNPRQCYHALLYQLIQNGNLTQLFVVVKLIYPRFLSNFLLYPSKSKIFQKIRN